MPLFAIIRAIASNASATATPGSEDCERAATVESTTTNPSTTVTSGNEDGASATTSEPEHPPAHEAPVGGGGVWAQHPEDIDHEQVDRVRRFLLFSLAVDYGLTTSAKGYLKLEEWCYFMRLSRLVHRAHKMTDWNSIQYENGKLDAHNADMEPESDCQIMREQLYKPIWLLNIPASVAVALVKQFPSRVGVGGGHHTILEPSFQVTVRELATRLLVDREVLFEALFEGDSERKDMLGIFRDANKALTETYFARLDSPRSYTLRHLGEAKEKYFRYIHYDRMDERQAITGWKRNWCAIGLEHLFSAVVRAGGSGRGDDQSRALQEQLRYRKRSVARIVVRTFT